MDLFFPGKNFIIFVVRLFAFTLLLPWVTLYAPPSPQPNFVFFFFFSFSFSINSTKAIFCLSFENHPCAHSFGNKAVISSDWFLPRVFHQSSLFHFFLSAVVFVVVIGYIIILYFLTGEFRPRKNTKKKKNNK